MKILWLCNLMLPVVAKALGLPINNKEGWLSGLSEEVLSHKDENNIELSVCFPVPRDTEAMKGKVENLSYYGFCEDIYNPERYDSSLENALTDILNQVKPDLVHVFGTEYAHTLAVTRCMKNTNKVVIGVQGICSEIAKKYMTGLPKTVQNRFLLRDLLKHDNIRQQQDKFVLRGNNEIEALKNVKNVIGRTAWDKEKIAQINSEAIYYVLNETLRSNFYGKEWDFQTCEKHTIFFSQANYPLKGFHLLLKAMPELITQFPDLKVYVAGDIITRYESIYDKIKIGSYGKYCLSLIKQYGLKNHISFLGKLSSEEMCNQYLRCHLFLSASALENSPNSVGEAMLLGMPVVSSRVGGVSSMLTDQEEGLLYETEDTKALVKAIETIFTEDTLALQYGQNARKRALMTHNAERNYQRLLVIYNDIVSC